MSKVTELYKSMLASMGMTVDSKGFVSTLNPADDVSRPMMVGEKRLVLPYPEQLEIPDWSNRIGFHPLMQNFSAGDSEVMDAVRNRANRHYDFVIGMTFLNIATLAADKESHKDLTPEQAKYLRPFSDADQKFVAVLQNIIGAKQSVKKGYEFIRFSIVKGREWHGQKRNRVAVASFPLYEELPKENKPCTIAGQKLSIKQTVMLRSMFEFIFEHIKEKNYYEFGSDSKLGPSIESFFGLLDIIIANHNKHISTLEGPLHGTQYLYIPNEWSGTLKDIASLSSEIRSIPPMEGNAGRTRTGGQATAPVAIAEPSRAVASPIQVTETSTPVMNQQFAQQAAQQESKPSPYRVRIGDPAPTAQVDARTQLPDTTQHQQMHRPATQGVLNMAGFQPTPPVGSQLAAQQMQSQHYQPQNPGFVAPQVAAMHQPVQPQMTQQPMVTKVPESAVMLNGQMFIPLEVQGTGTPPVGTIIHNGKLYIPYGVAAAAVAPVQQFQPGYGAPGGFGVQQAVADPAQVPGLSEQEINFYRANPALFQSFLTQRSGAQGSMVQQQQNQRLNSVPPYLQRLAQQEQEQNNRNRFGGFVR